MEEIKRSQKIANKSVESLADKSGNIENSIFTKVLAFVRELDVGSDGKVKLTAKNIRKLNSFKRKELKKIILNERYQKAVQVYLNSFDRLAKTTIDHFNAQPDDQ